MHKEHDIARLRERTDMLTYCFESAYVPQTLARCRRNDLAVIDTDGIPAETVRNAVARGVFAYGYLNAGALEKERSYYQKYKDLRLAKYDGWEGEYWIDVTAKEWKEHLISEAEKIRKTGAIGVYFDNVDIYWMCQEGFKEQKSTMLRKAPYPANVYTALREIIRSIVNDVGLIVMPNGGDGFVRRLVGECPRLIYTVNQEGVLYQDKKRQSKEDTKYFTEYLDWCIKHKIYVRGIEYPKTKAQALYAKSYYKKHGWQGIYISYHKELRGD